MTAGSMIRARQSQFIRNSIIYPSSYPAHAGYPVFHRRRIEPKRRGVLDHPLSRMMTVGGRPRGSSLRHCERQRSNPWPKQRGSVDCFVAPLLAMTRTIETQLRILATRSARAMPDPYRLREQRAQGKPGARRTRSLACEIKQAHERSHHRFTGFTRPSLRNGFNGFLRALPGDRAFLSPSPRGLPRET
jgi:hypothetical protein